MTTKKTAAISKVSEDRAAKAEALNEPVTVTVQGFEFSFEPNNFDDDDMMTALEQGNPNPALAMIAGDQVDAVKKHLRDEGGKLKRSVLLEFVVEVMQAVGEGND